MPVKDALSRQAGRLTARVTPLPIGTIMDADSCRIEAVLAFWFRGRALSASRIERRMGAWFGEDPGFDHEIEREFKGDVAAASAGQCIHWANVPRGRLALILLLDQFRRNIYRGTAAAFARDQAALALCMAGILDNQDQDLAPIEQILEALNKSIQDLSEHAI